MHVMMHSNVYNQACVGFYVVLSCDYYNNLYAIVLYFGFGIGYGYQCVK